MNRSFHRWLRRGVLALAVAGAWDRAWAQSRLPRYQEPQLLDWHFREASVGVYAEGTRVDTSYDNGGNSASHERWFIGPSFGLSLDGSIYHPNLLQFSLSEEIATGIAEDRVRSGGSSSSRQELEYLGWLNASASILSGRPYHGNLFANYGHSYRDYDFFNRVTVDTWHYGGGTTYNVGPWNFNLNYNHRDEDVSASLLLAGGPSSTREDVVSFLGGNDRKSGSTSFGYNFTRYSRADFDVTGEGREHLFTLSDSEHFGSLDQFRLNSGLSYVLRDTSPESSEEFLANLDFSAAHPHNFNSYYDLNYDRFLSGGYAADNVNGQAQLQHKLFESLLSAFIVRAANFESSDQGNSGYTRRFGIGNTEAYTKRIGLETRLRISNSLFVDHTDREALGIVKNEAHVFGEPSAPPDSFLLELPNVLPATIVVTDSAGTQPPFVEGIDYDVTLLGTRTVIERVTGSRIPVGATVLVDYETEPSPPGSYETLTETFQIRMEFWKNLLGVYGRVNLFANNAAEELRVQNIISYTAGVDTTWRWLQAGAEYQLYDSDESDYRSARVFQSLAFHPDPASTLNFDFSETWIQYSGNNPDQENFRFTSRYQRRLTHRFSFEASAGTALRRGGGPDEILATFRPAIKYVIGKTSIDAVYDYEQELFVDRLERQKHMFYIRVKRVF
jgi:hypothetical protein